MEWCLFLACNGGDSFCVGQCKLGEGDCDSDSDFEGNLVLLSRFYPLHVTETLFLIFNGGSGQFLLTQSKQLKTTARIDWNHW